ncbi:MAG TPA: glycogen debranching protein GlgX [Geobacterales bacterium]|nr:glycogen debranching protein GlgX [Geobacterales bacterium]
MRCPYPIGSTYIEEKGGTAFVIFSEFATKVELQIYSEDQKYPKESVELRNRYGDLWLDFISGIKPGQLYAYRIHGPYKPNEGLRFNPNKIVIDPYAKAIAGTIPIKWDDSLFDYKPNITGIFEFNEVPDDLYVPKCVVVDSNFNWEDKEFIKRGIDLKDLLIYETHVKGFTILNKEIPEHLRGTYAALATKQVIDYLNDLGVNVIELMPVHAFLDDKILVERGLRNYWGYNPINYFSPDARYSSSGSHGQQVIEFKKMVNELHNAGIAVILDVVYNHTGEGNHLGPTISFRGIDNLSYYLLSSNDKTYYIDYTGVGNTLNTTHPRVIQMILDSLRYWVQEMHVDGFRFDVAPVLAREYEKINMNNALMIAIRQDPILSRAILIAEPWDLGPNGYQLGNFPLEWAEWNGKYRDIIRRFWRGEMLPYGEIANRITGSRDIFVKKDIFSSINYITCHDGFTLEDLVSYNQKHNEANGFENKDGADENFSWNCGVEGPTDKQEIIELRERIKRNFIITLFISQGIPMLLGGDELSRTQKGNNNAFCQDNEISWYSWELDERRRRFLEFVKSAIKFRKENTALNFPKGIIWFNKEGKQVDQSAWNSTTNFLAFFITLDSKEYLIVLNAGEAFEFPLPEGKWEVIISSYKDKGVVCSGKEQVDKKSATIFIKRV